MSHQLLKLNEVMQRVPLSRSRIYSLIQCGVFPSPIKIVPGGRASAWRAEDVEQFIQQRVSTIKG